MIRKLPVCAFIVITLFVIFRALLIGGWIQFMDLTSLSIVLFPTMLAFWVGSLRSLNIAARAAFKTAIISGCLGTTLSLVLVLSPYEFDSLGLVYGLSVALLPLFYALVIALLLSPFSIKEH